MTRTSMTARIAIAAACCIRLLTPASASALTPEQIRRAYLDLMLSRAAYDLSIKQVDGDWRQLDTFDDRLGLKAAAYERRGANGSREIVVAFAGTDDFGDVLADIRQGKPWYEISLGSWLTHRKFEQAVAFAERYVRIKDKDGNCSVRVVGHSLGGALAQYVSARLGILARVFNSSALASKTHDIPAILRSVPARQIEQYFLSDDPVHEWTAKLPGAHQLGTPYELERPAGLDTGNFGGRLLANHSIEALSLAMEAAYLKAARGANASSDRDGVDLGAGDILHLPSDLQDKRSSILRNAR